MELNNIIQKAQAVIQNFDVSAANKILGAIRNQRLNNSQAIHCPENLIVQLKIVAFANLLEEEAIDIIQYHYLESFAIDVLMRNQITSSLFSVPYLVRDELRKKFNTAIRGNTERIGPLTIGQWIAEFDRKFNIQTRDRSASVQFVMSHPQAMMLSPIDQKILKDILYTYDYLLIDTLPDTGDDLDIILNNTNFQTRENSFNINNYTHVNSQKKPSPVPMQYINQAQLLNLSLNDALKHYPEIGEQLLTSERITLKNFPEPVRPSLKNWLADYVFTVGYDNTDAIKRSNYVFHGNNTMRLSAAERQKLAYILKAHDEHLEIMVDAERKQLVFQAPEQVIAPTAQKHSSSNEEGAKRTPNVQSAPQSSASLHNSVSFSSPQQLPYEKINTPQPIKKDFVSQVKFPPIQPLRPTNQVNNIVKLEPKPEKPREMPRNVVNLRDEQ